MTFISFVLLIQIIFIFSINSFNYLQFLLFTNGNSIIDNKNFIYIYKLNYVILKNIFNIYFKFFNAK